MAEKKIKRYINFDMFAGLERVAVAVELVLWCYRIEEVCGWEARL